MVAFPATARLDADARAVIDAMSSTPRPPLQEMPIEDLRALMVKMPGPPVHDVHDDVIPLPGHDLAVRVYRPRAEEGLPLLVYLHGGGWVMGTLDGYDALCRDLANRAECVVVSVDYRLAPEHPFPAGLEDSYAALGWVAAHAGRYGGDPGRVAVAGDSAGGNLATVCCTLARDRCGPDLGAQLLIYPGIDPHSTRPAMTDSDGPVLTVAASAWMWRTYVRDDADLSSPYVAPLHADTLAGLPRAVIVTADVDINRDDAVAYAERLAGDAVPVEILHYPGTFHGFLMYTDAVAKARTAMDEIGTRLRTAFAHGPRER